jgi:hypothetical protein
MNSNTNLENPRPIVNVDSGLKALDVPRLVVPSEDCRGTLDIVGMDHPKLGQIIIRDKTTKKSLLDKYHPQYVDTYKGYFVNLREEDHEPEIVFNDNLEILCPVEE